jgi:hypothetical protein
MVGARRRTQPPLTHSTASLDQTVPVLQRMRLAASQIDEVVQVLRAKLLVTSDAG